MKWKRGLSLSLVVLSAFLLTKANYFFNDGFRVHKVYYAYPYRSQWDVEDLSSKEDLQKVLAQDFTYLGKGRQAYVFESQDKKFVLKFVRQAKYRVPFWSRFFSFCPFLKSYREKNVSQKEARFFRAMNSYALAFRSLKAETGLLYIHLQPTGHSIGSVTIQDRLGRSFSVPLDRTAFLLQRKVQSLIPLLEGLYKEGKREQLRELFALFLRMAHQRTQKGILNRDFLNCMRNCGYVQGRVVEVDVGSFYRKEAVALSPALEREVVCFSAPLREFILKKMPELSVLLEEELQAMIKDSHELLDP